MSPGPESCRPKTGSFPRVSGDEPHTTEAGLGLVKFSPRERG